jgi:ABC-type transporter Mla MlaB component
METLPYNIKTSLKDNVMFVELSGDLSIRYIDQVYLMLKKSLMKKNKVKISLNNIKKIDLSIINLVISLKNSLKKEDLWGGVSFDICSEDKDLLKKVGLYNILT